MVNIFRCVDAVFSTRGVVAMVGATFALAFAAPDAARSLAAAAPLAMLGVAAIAVPPCAVGYVRERCFGFKGRGGKDAGAVVLLLLGAALAVAAAELAVCAAVIARRPPDAGAWAAAATLLASPGWRYTHAALAALSAAAQLLLV